MFTSISELFNGERALSPREHDLLTAAFKLHAISSFHRVTADELVARAIGAQADANNFKKPLRILVQKGFLHALQRRGGGYWLTDEGLALANMFVNDPTVTI